MNDHSKRLLNRVISIIDEYEQGEIDEEYLMSYVEGTNGAIEEREINEILEQFVIKIGNSLYLYDIEEGRINLQKEIKLFKEQIEN